MSGHKGPPKCPNTRVCRVSTTYIVLLVYLSTWSVAEKNGLLHWSTRRSGILLLVPQRDRAVGAAKTVRKGAVDMDSLLCGVVTMTVAYVQVPLCARHVHACSRARPVRHVGHKPLQSYQIICTACSRNVRQHPRCTQPDCTPAYPKGFCCHYVAYIDSREDIGIPFKAPLYTIEIHGPFGYHPLSLYKFPLQNGRMFPMSLPKRAWAAQ